MSASSRNNYESYNGDYYSTLSDAPVDGIAQLCQKGYITLPTYFEIASLDVDSATVISEHPWSTQAVTLADGSSWRSSSSPYSQLSSGNLTQSGNQYKPTSCGTLILLKCKCSSIISSLSPLIRPSDILLSQLDSS